MSEEKSCKNCIRLFEPNGEGHVFAGLDRFGDHVEICPDAYSIEGSHCERWAICSQDAHLDDSQDARERRTEHIQAYLVRTKHRRRALRPQKRGRFRSSSLRLR